MNQNWSVTGCHAPSQGSCVCFAASFMGHLQIQILGPLKAWSVTDDGLWHPLKMPDQRGWTTWGLLAAVVFLPPEDRNWRALAGYLYDDLEIEGDKKGYENFRQVWNRTRKGLGPHGNTLSAVSGYELTGRDDTSGPRQVFVDWDDVRRYEKAGHFKEALSLLSRGRPLPGFPDSEAHLGKLVDEILPIVHEMIERSLHGAGIVSDPLPWSRPGAYSAYLPDEWAPLLEAPAPGTPPEDAAADRKRKRIPHPPATLANFTEDELFEPCLDGKARLARELAEVAADGGDVWWGSCQWFGAYVALWHRTLTTPCGEIAFRYVDDVYDAARLGLKGVDAPKEKATLIEAPKQLGDNDNKQIICGKTNWGVAQVWARAHADELFSHPLNLSVFGVRGRPVYPNMLAVHTLVQTSDQFLLFALRSPEVDLYKITWSASCEEGVSVGPREFTGPPTSGDETVLHTLQGSLLEEWGIEEDAIRDSSCLAIGREWASEEHETDTTLYLSPVVIAACRLTLSLAEVWARLDEVPRIRDRDEHRAWAGCRFATRDALLRFVVATRGRKENSNLLQELCDAVDGVELCMYPKSATHLRDRGMMPTSQARLVLGSAWFAYQESIDKIVT